MHDVVIYGAGGLGGLVADILHQVADYRPVGFLDSDPQRHGQQHADLPILGGVGHLDRVRDDGIAHVVVAIGDNYTRVSIAETLARRGFRLASAIHPLASISPSATLAEHVIIGPRATVCVHTQIGPHVVLSAGAITDHDNVIQRGAFLHPAARLAGGVHVAEFATLGIGATVIPGRSVGRGARVEAGAVVIKDVPTNVTVAGVPATIGGTLESRFVPDPPAAAEHPSAAREAVPEATAR
jgi:acetyltransferase EpsM